VGKTLTTIALIITVLLYLSYKPKTDDYLVELKDGCLVLSIYHKNVLLANEMLRDQIWCKVIGIDFYRTPIGHAVLLYHYGGKTYVYDPAQGSLLISNYLIYNPLNVAEIMYPKLDIRKAYFLEPTMLLHYGY
jgi:hypothetical protein